MQTLPSGVFEIGLVLFETRDQGKGYGRQAVALIAGWLFDETDAERVQAGTALDNMAMRAVLTRLGFQLEGIARAYGRRTGGTRVDCAVYAILKQDWLRANAGERSGAHEGDPAAQIASVQRIES